MRDYVGVEQWNPADSALGILNFHPHEAILNDLAVEHRDLCAFGQLGDHRAEWLCA